MRKIPEQLKPQQTNQPTVAEHKKNRGINKSAKLQGV
jgi:hypothetical protein